jgi:tetratricopeptide (TPR) repeat protein
MNGEIVENKDYQMIQYYAAVAAINAGLIDESINLLEELKNKNYENLTVYQLLYGQLNLDKKSEKSLQILKEGHQKFPNEDWFLQNLINQTIGSGQNEEAIFYIQKIINKYPNNEEYRRVKADVELSLGKIDEAIESYNKAIQLNSKYALAHFSLGRLYFNKAIELNEKCDKIKDEAINKIERNKVDELFRKSLPYFQKAVEITPNELDYLTALKTLYKRLEMNAEYNTVDLKIKSLK